MDSLHCSHILFVLKSCHFSLCHNAVLPVWHCALLHWACTNVPSKVTIQNTRNCYRLCQNYIMLSLCHYLFLFVFVLFWFCLSFWRHCLSVDISKNAGKFILFYKSTEPECTHFILCWFYFIFFNHTHLFDCHIVAILVFYSHTAALWMQWFGVKVLEGKHWCENSVLKRRFSVPSVR